MVSEGITRRRLPADNDVICTLNAPDIYELASTMNNTRSAAALEHWRDRLEGAVIAIGNAPTALYLLNMLQDPVVKASRHSRLSGWFCWRGRK